MAITDFWNGVGDWTGNPSDWSTKAPPPAGDIAEVQTGALTLSTAADVDQVIVAPATQLLLVKSASLTTTAGVFNLGSLGLDSNGGDGGGSLTIGGALSNLGGLTVGNSALDAVTKLTTHDLLNSGALVVQGNGGAGTTDQATLDDTAAAPGVVTGVLDVRGDADLEFASSTLSTVGSGATLEIDGAQARISVGAATTNSALGGLSVNEGTFVMRGGTGYGAGGAVITTTKAFTNYGQAEIDSFGGDGGSKLTLGGVLTNTGTFTLGNPALSASSTLTAGGLTNTGALDVQGSNGSGTTDQATLDDTAAAPGVVTGVLDVRGDADLEFASSTLSTVGSGATLEIDGAQARISVGAATTNSALGGLSVNEGTFVMRGGTGYGAGGAVITTTKAFTNYGQAEIDSFGGDGGSKLTLGGVLTNTGTFTLGNPALSASSTLTAGGLTNTGALDVQGSNGSGTTDQATLDDTAAAPGVVTGVLDVRGDADLEFASSTLSTVGSGATLEIDGAQARISVGAATTNSALGGLSVNEGTFVMRGGTGYGAGGAVITTTKAFTNYGQAEIDSFGGDGGSKLTLGGVLTNTGTFTLGNPALSASSTLTAGGLTNTGALDVQGSNGSGTTDQATLDDTAAAPGVVTGVLDVRGDADLEFASSTLSTVGSGATLEIDGAQARISVGAATTNSALGGLSVNEGTFVMRGGTGYGAGGAVITTTKAFTNYGQAEIDSFGGDGGSKLTLGGVLTNTGTFTLGNPALSASSTLTAGGLTNTGALVVQGNGGAGTTDQATLDDTAAAPGVVTGVLDVRGDADLEFASSTLSTVGSGATLEIDGAQARISVGAATTNSALGGLSVNEGTFVMRGGTGYGAGGAVITTTKAFTNYGQAEIDSFGGDGGSKLTLGGVLTNTGTFTLGNPALSASSTLTAGGLTNTGALDVQGSNGSGTTDQATLDDTAAAPGVVTGVLDVRGDADLEFASSTLSTVGSGATLEIDGAQARISVGAATTNSALGGLSVNEGTFVMRGGTGYGAGGAVITTTKAFTNYGQAEIDSFGGDGGSKLTLGGVLTNTGTFTLGNPALSASTTVIASSIVNSGTVNLFGAATLGTTEQATLDITGASTLSGAYYLHGDSELELASGITSIAAGVFLQLDGAQARIATGGGSGNSGLGGLGGNAGDVDLEGDWSSGPGGSSVSTSTGFSNTGSLSMDIYGGDGASKFSVAKTLINSGTISIGNGGLSATTSLTAGGLSNTGQIQLSGSAGQTAELVVGGAADNAGGVVIGSGAEVDVTGANAYVQTIGATTVTGFLVASTVDDDGGLIEFTTAVTKGDGLGALDIGGAGVAKFDSSVDSSHTVTFKAATGTIELGAPGSFASVIAGFGGNDVIDLLGAAVTSLSYSGSSSSGVLTVSGSGGVIAKLALTGDYTTGSFTTVSDGSGGTDILDPPASHPRPALPRTSRLAHAVAGFGAASGLSSRDLPGEDRATTFLLAPARS